MVRILLYDYVYRTAHGRSSELGGNHAFVYLDAVNHINGNVVKVQEIGLVGHRGLINEESYALAFQTANGQSLGASQTACGSDCYAYGLGKYALDITYSTLKLLHADNGNWHCLLTQYSCLAFF